MHTDVAPLIEGITQANRTLFARFDPDVCIAAFDAVPNEMSYHHIPESVDRLWKSVSAQFGTAGFDAFQRLTMLKLIGTFNARVANRRYTDATHMGFEKSYARIVDAIADPAFADYRGANDILFKDLGLCRQKLFPAGAVVVEPDSGFHRSMLLRVSEAFAITRLMLETGGNRHWYQIHSHLSELEDFNPEGWDAAYLRLADMLALNPEIRGMYGVSWLYDPALEEVSPWLVYLRKVPRENGAYVFFSHGDINGGALAKSETRRQAYAAGEYMPKSYAVIWPRRALIAWAAGIRKKSA